MKRRVLISSGLLAILVVIALIIVRRDLPRSGSTPNTSGARGPATMHPSQESSAAVSNGLPRPSNAKRAKMSDNDRLQWLEKLGHVPDGADTKDWQLAQQTSWWGKPLDPNAFWAGRTVWLDEEARLAARSRGRTYPPIPYDDPTIPRAKNDDQDIETSGLWDVEGPNLRFHVTNRETRFWDRFQKTRPKPPGELERDQFQLAERILARRFDFEHSNQRRETAKSLTEAEAVDRKRAQELGCPAEAFSDEALYWAYVTKRKQEHEELVTGGHPTNGAAFKAFFFGLSVDPQRIATRLTEIEIKAANAWKIAYLQRLRREKVDESYINAYLQAWNLLPVDVFPEYQRP